MRSRVDNAVIVIIAGFIVVSAVAGCFGLLSDAIATA
jgi:hypothetical protein